MTNKLRSAKIELTYENGTVRVIDLESFASTSASIRSRLDIEFGHRRVHGSNIDAVIDTGERTLSLRVNWNASSVLARLTMNDDPCGAV